MGAKKVLNSLTVSVSSTMAGDPRMGLFLGGTHITSLQVVFLRVWVAGLELISLSWVVKYLQLYLTKKGPD